MVSLLSLSALNSRERRETFQLQQELRHIDKAYLNYVMGSHLFLVGVQVCHNSTILSTLLQTTVYLVKTTEILYFDFYGSVKVLHT